MYHMDIPKTRQYDTGKIEVVARSSIGEALATAELKVVQRKDDYRGVLKNSPRREYNIEKRQHINKICKLEHNNTIKSIIWLHLQLLYFSQ